MNHVTKNLIASLLALLLTSLSACASPFGLSGEAIEGKVLEAGTNKPIPHAIVVVRWDGILSGFAEQRGVCVHVESTATDEQGRYRINAWRKPSTLGGVRDIGPTVSAYQPSYEIARRDRENNMVYLRPFTGGRGERLQYLDRVISSTSCGDKSTHQNLYRIHRAVYEEARAIAQTEEEKKQVERLKWIAEYSLVNLNKPTKSDGRGRTINVDPNDSFKPEDLLK